jgi:hypothetical protein
MLEYQQYVHDSSFTHCVEVLHDVEKGSNEDLDFI